jgi:hypothetical protein
MTTSARLSAFSIGCAAALSCLASAGPAAAFCGFYVKPGEEELKNPATNVVMMREGTRTVLSMRNDYQGPAEDFAMVVPVPQAIQRENVRTLPNGVFEKIDTLSAPRLVEYWEHAGECFSTRGGHGFGSIGVGGIGVMGYGRGAGGSYVRITAQFEVGEYDVVVLDASDSSSLETWLVDNGYNIPRGASELLRPYIESGHHFFVAKVDVDRVRFERGVARLSPLRIHYDSAQFSLPVRLGLINNGGAQDLLVHILADTRFEAANYPNVLAPTNLHVRGRAKGRFGELYAAVFDEVSRRNPGAIVTEYAWAASSCDPCPGPTLSEQDVLTLGGDVLPGRAVPSLLTLTRLHYRYAPGSLSDDIVFRPASGIVGGRGMPDEEGRLLNEEPTSGAGSAFQTRFAILHRIWHELPACPEGQRRTESYWGGPPNGYRGRDTTSSGDTSKVRRGGIRLLNFIRGRVPSLGLRVPRDPEGPTAQERDTRELPVPSERFAFLHPGLTRRRSGTDSTRSTSGW